MEIKHLTPYPWIASSYGFQVLGNEQRASVCSLDGKKTPENQLADAKLIAAAPELLEALIEVVRISDRTHVAWDKAKQAIKKATE